MTSSRNRTLAVLTALAAVWAVPVTAQSAESRPLAARSLAALKAGNVTAARRFADQAARSDPAWGDAQILVARTAIAAGDGVSAEAAITRARDAGIDARRLHLLLAEARLLQGDAEQARRLTGAAGARQTAQTLAIIARADAAQGDVQAAETAFAAAVAADPGRVETWVAYGGFRQDIGDTGGAIEAVGRALAAAPHDTAALRLRARLVRQQYGLVAALPWFEGVLQRDPDDFDALIDYAATLGDLGRAGDMLRATRRALAVRPNAPRAMYLLSVLAARAGNADLARNLMQRAGDSVAAMPGALLLGATLDLDAGGGEQAVMKLRNLVALQPMNLPARRLLGLALLRSGAAQEALNILRPVATRDDADPYVLTLAARAFEARGDRIMAAEMLDRAAVPVQREGGWFSADDSVATLAAADREGFNRPARAAPLIRGFLDEGDGARALARAESVAAANPGSPEAAIVLGDTLAMLGRGPAAASAYRRAADLRFDEAAMLRLTTILDQIGARRDAAEVLTSFIDQNPRNLAALRLAAHWQVAGGEFEAAIDTLEQLRTRTGGRDVAVLGELSLAYQGAGNLDAARSFAAAAYALSPSNAAAADAYGWISFAAGDSDGALQLLQKAVTLDPGHPWLRWHLAQVYAAIGRLPEARFHARAALSNPRFPDRDAAARVVAA